MLSLGRSLRFGSEEIDRYARIGIDLENVRSVDQLSRAIECWALNMCEVRPDLVHKLARTLRDREAEQSARAAASGEEPAAEIKMIP